MFGFDEKLAVRQNLRFSQNGLVISSVDIQSVEPVDQRTRDALQKSVQLAIEITTNSQEATARSVYTSHLSLLNDIIISTVVVQVLIRFCVIQLRENFSRCTGVLFSCQYF